MNDRSHNFNRLIAAAYGSTSGPYNDPNGNPGACTPGAYATTYTENYAYVAAGGVATKDLWFSRSLGNDINGNPQYAGGSATVNYTYDSAGRTSSISYPMADRTPGYNAFVTLTYGFDSMGRPASLTDNMASVMGSGSNTSWAQGVTYDFAGRMTQMQYPKSTAVTTAIETETMSYNVATGQLATAGWTDNWNSGTLTPTGSLQYTYSGTQNNGQITQMTDGISKETIVYQYDALKRLISATSTPETGSSVTAWTQTYCV